MINDLKINKIKRTAVIDEILFVSCLRNSLLEKKEFVDRAKIN